MLFVSFEIHINTISKKKIHINKKIYIKIRVTENIHKFLYQMAHKSREKH